MITSNSIDDSTIREYTTRTRTTNSLIHILKNNGEKHGLLFKSLIDKYSTADLTPEVDFDLELEQSNVVVNRSRKKNDKTEDLIQLSKLEKLLPHTSTPIHCRRTLIQTVVNNKEEEIKQILPFTTSTPITSSSLRSSRTTTRIFKSVNLDTLNEELSDESSSGNSSSSSSSGKKNVKLKGARFVLEQLKNTTAADVSTPTTTRSSNQQQPVKQIRITEVISCSNKNEIFRSPHIISTSSSSNTSSNQRASGRSNDLLRQFLSNKCLPSSSSNDTRSEKRKSSNSSHQDLLKKLLLEKKPV